MLLPVARSFDPQLIIVSAGFDAAVNDPLGECAVTPHGYAQMMQGLLPLAGGRIVVVLEGGYNLHSISASMSACAAVLLGKYHPSPPGDTKDTHTSANSETAGDARHTAEDEDEVWRAQRRARSARESIDETLACLRPHWPVLTEQSQTAQTHL